MELPFMRPAFSRVWGLAFGRWQLLRFRRSAAFSRGTWPGDEWTLYRYWNIGSIEFRWYAKYI